MMSATRIGLFVMLCCPGLALADGVLELVPTTAGPYLNGDYVPVEVHLHNLDRVGYDLRLVQLDSVGNIRPFFAGGRFTTSGSTPVSGVARYEEESWFALGLGLERNGMIVEANAMVTCDIGGGPKLFVGGTFDTAGGISASNIASWDGAVWTALGSGVDGTVHALAVHDDGSGPALYVGGEFTVAGGVTVNRIARWDGSTWSALGDGVTVGSRIDALGEYDADGAGPNPPALYAGGYFTEMDGVAANYVARWEQGTWSSLSGGTSGEVYAIAGFDDGSGSALYVGGSFTKADGLLAINIAKWNGASWSDVGWGLNSTVKALTTYDDGIDTTLYAGGSFSTANGVPTAHVAKWDGSIWSAAGDGLDSDVNALATLRDGGIPVLIAGGRFTASGDTVVNHVAAWDGAQWSRMAPGFDLDVLSLCPDDDGSVPGDGLVPTDANFEFSFDTLPDPNIHGYFVFPKIQRPAIVYLGMSPDPALILHLPAAGSLNLGTVGVRIPAERGVFQLDLANANTEETGGGAMIAFDFEFPTYWKAVNGELTGGTYTFCTSPSAYPPLPKTYSTGPCTQDSECLNTASCIEGVCYAPKNRYVSIDPNPANAGTLTARRVSLDLGGGQTAVLGWVGEPAEIAITGPEVTPQLIARIVDAPHYRDWSVDNFGDPWVDETIQLGDCEISPQHTYLIQSIAEGCDVDDDSVYSEALALPTTTLFGDIVGATTGTPPDEARNFKDINAVYRGFQSVQTEPKAWLDLQGSTATPEIPDFSDINLQDVNWAIAGFQGADYPFAAPCDCVTPSPCP